MEKKILPKHHHSYSFWVDTLLYTNILQALKKVRKIIREFDSYKLESPILAREFFNKEIGFY